VPLSPRAICRCDARLEILNESLAGVGGEGQINARGMGIRSPRSDDHQGPAYQRADAMRDDWRLKIVRARIQKNPGPNRGFSWSNLAGSGST
jgi:hypothetical protein